MKLRTSFVTNSSSSSFVVIGIRTDRQAIEKLEEEKCWGKYLWNDDGYIVGDVIHNEEWGYGKTYMHELIERFQETKEWLTSKGFDASSIALHYGMRYC